MDLLSILINHIDENKEMYNAILVNNRNGILIDFLIDATERDFLQRIKSDNKVVISNIPIDTIVKFYTGGLINIGISWLTEKEKYTKEEILSYIDKLIPEKI